ncbi:hypothetical protein QYE76_048570 [Lolium multiflorum]|uniref:Uncharacterized protein n=1 Tax=Lolium multiflorum TaxID=4521 RepID=A0AAD8SNE9_LOLMU|nr:hypothetical protein QYE76_048570 [Lolium multiflorum]
MSTMREENADGVEGEREEERDHKSAGHVLEGHTRSRARPQAKARADDLRKRAAARMARTSRPVALDAAAVGRGMRGCWRGGDFLPLAFRAGTELTQLPSRTASTLLRFGPDAATATVAMDPVKWDEMRNKSKAELMAQLNELKAELKRPPPVAPNKQMEELRPFLVEMSKKIKAELREVYRNREPLILDLRLNSKEDPCCTAASPPGVVMLPASSEDGEAFSEDGEGNEA